MHDFRLLPQIVKLKPGKRRRPIERFGNAWNLTQILLANGIDHARDLQRQRGVDAGRARQDDPRFAVDVGEIDIVIEAAPAQRVGQFAGAVGGQHHARDRGRFDGAKFRDADLEFRQQLEQESLEFLVGAVDLVDQQHRRLFAAYGGEQRPLEQIALGEDVLLDTVGVLDPSRVLMASSWRW